MKTRGDSILKLPLFIKIGAGVIGAAAVLLFTSNAPAQNLFVSDWSSEHIFEYTPAGAQTTFASGLAAPEGIAFNPAGNLFEADEVTESINEFTPTGSRTTFASGLSGPA